MAAGDARALRQRPWRAPGKAAVEALKSSDPKCELIVEHDQSCEPVANPCVREPQGVSAFSLLQQDVPAVRASQTSAGVVDIRGRELMSFGIAVWRSDKSYAKRKKLRTPDHWTRTRRQVRVAEDEASPAIGEFCEPGFLGDGVRLDTLENARVVLAKFGIAAQELPGETGAV
jgi:hypothetical protein